MENTGILKEKGKILAPEQLFTYPLENNTEETIRKAKIEITSCASHMGFNVLKGDWKVEKFHDTDDGKIKWRLEATFTAV